MMLVKDSTLGTGVMSVVMGYVIGVVFTLFGAVIATETSTQTMGAADFMKSTLRNSHRSGKNFALFGLLFGGLDVMLEKRRGKKDFWNPTVVGGLIGGGYGFRYYKYPGLVGGYLGGAGASLLLELLMDKMGMSQR
ncbi:inner membrane preprotein translocase Tim17 [Angomonas deanei]|uniref:Mitochondrial import inner membrane translocase subunit TIM22 n=1 Tax=Angomonas deanei TaxID=59799 RepID=A0A7G2CMZ5_9TRYP|nr:inner membrane preprotein translocase Tim17 [Angomonas deanei]CAD2220437.1 Tim17/Tim22/Tim23/Pmp24 family, putative [Angomonas deanei]|eukprot:EPY36111.1 inner membrane preprotein translocase Tim17 [Angomonas deanei]